MFFRRFLTVSTVSLLVVYDLKIAIRGLGEGVFERTFPLHFVRPRFIFIFILIKIERKNIQNTLNRLI